MGDSRDEGLSHNKDVVCCVRRVFVGVCVCVCVCERERERCVGVMCWVWYSNCCRRGR